MARIVAGIDTQDDGMHVLAERRFTNGTLTVEFKPGPPKLHSRGVAELAAEELDVPEFISAVASLGI